MSGSPPSVTLQARTYAFRPSASDAEGDRLTFSIANRPAWATFSNTTGRLRGTPSATDLGSFDGITITVSDGRASTSLGPFSIHVTAVASGAATLTWNPPMQNTDGSPLSDLAGYRIRWGTQIGEYANAVNLDSPGLAAYTIDQLTPATWYFVVSAVNGNGIESRFSNAASKTVQ